MTLLVDFLAVYRLTRLLQLDDILEAPRDELRRALRRHAKLLELTTCPWCLSVWIAFGVVVLRRVRPRFWDPIATALAASAVAGVVTTWAERP